jgi:hypothetical protein|tara:strand:+ start:10160 stop:11296 length:1137 start_codon:yes stop_codon:yes gene_type:complete
MEIKVKDLGSVDEKSMAEKEQEVLDKAAQKNEVAENVNVVEETTPQQTESVEAPAETPKEEIETQSSELNEEDVLSFIKNRYNKEVSSVGDLFEKKESNVEIPEDVAAYLEYRKKTGRSFEDYSKLNRDFNAMDEKQLLREYYSATEDALDSEDIDYMMEDFSYDADIDEESVIKKKKVAFKKEIGKAKKFFEKQKEMYKEPLESSVKSISQEQQENLEAYNKYVQDAQTYEEEAKRKRDWFLDKTEEVFHPEFKGFDFKVGEDKVITFLPSKNVSEIKRMNSDSTNFINKFLDDKTGLVSDAQGYHRALAIAQNPERFAKFFYEQGQSDATTDVTKKIKNVNMSTRNAPQVAKKDGMTIRAINPSEGRGLKIRSNKK